MEVSKIGAPTFWDGVSRGMGEMFASVITGMMYYLILDALKLLPYTEIGEWMAFLIYLLTMVGILELLETFLKSQYWNDKYLMGYLVGILGSTMIISYVGLVPDWMLLILTGVLMLSFLHRISRRMKWEAWW